MSTYTEFDVVSVVIAILKIGLMVFTVIHMFFLLFILKQVHTMKKLLSTFNQVLIQGMGITQILVMIIFLIYIIFLPQ